MSDIYQTQEELEAARAAAQEQANVEKDKTSHGLTKLDVEDTPFMRKVYPDRTLNREYNTYQAGGELGYQGSGLFNPDSALFGGSGAAAEQAYQDVNSTTGEAMSMGNIAKQSNNERQSASNAYGLSQLNAANTTLMDAALGLTGLGTTGERSALNIRGVAGPGTEGLTVQARNAAMLGQFDPTSAAAANTLHTQTLNNAAALNSLALSGRGGGVNASAQARGQALASGALAGEGLQQQQLAAQQYQSNQALALQALQGQSALGASYQQSALQNAQLSQQKQAIAAQAALQGAQTQYGSNAAANRLRIQQASNYGDLAKYQNQVAGSNVDAQQTLGQVNANYLGQAQDYHSQQLGTEAQLRTQGIINAGQTKAGLTNTLLGISADQDIANQAADTAMLGSMLSTGAGAVGAYMNQDKDK